MIHDIKTFFIGLFLMGSGLYDFKVDYVFKYLHRYSTQFIIIIGNLLSAWNNLFNNKNHLLKSHDTVSLLLFRDLASYNFLFFVIFTLLKFIVEYPQF